MPVDVAPFFDPDTATISYIASDPATGRCAIIDSVFNFDIKSGRTSHKSADALIEHVRRHNLTVEWILETHVHADHLSAAPYLKRVLGGQIGIGDRIPEVQRVFKALFNADAVSIDGRPFDRLFADGETFSIGGLTARVTHTPGHTPACVTYIIDGTAFVGDTLFMPDYGTARCDFPGGDAHALYRSIRRILELPPETRIFTAHDYLPGGRAPAWESTVAEQRAKNIHIHDGIGENEFVAMRIARDATLEMPTLLIPSVQVNIRAGELPESECNGRRYLKIPIDAF